MNSVHPCASSTDGATHSTSLTGTEKEPGKKKDVGLAGPAPTMNPLLVFSTPPRFTLRLPPLKGKPSTPELGAGLPPNSHGSPLFLSAPFHQAARVSPRLSISHRRRSSRRPSVRVAQRSSISSQSAETSLHETPTPQGTVLELSGAAPLSAYSVRPMAAESEERQDCPSPTPTPIRRLRSSPAPRRASASGQLGQPLLPFGAEPDRLSSHADDGLTLQHSNSHLIRLSEAKRCDSILDKAVELPFSCREETVPIPSRAVDDALPLGLRNAVGGTRLNSSKVLLQENFHGGASAQQERWKPGESLHVTYVTWNMASRAFDPDQVQSYCVHPNAHIIAVCTQENGPYVGLNTEHERWYTFVRDTCLEGKYITVGTNSLWGLHVAVFARRRDVARYIYHVETDKVQTGFAHGILGNKGGIGIAFQLGLAPQTSTTAHGGSPLHSAPAVMMARPSLTGTERNSTPTISLARTVVDPVHSGSSHGQTFLARTAASRVAEEPQLETESEAKSPATAVSTPAPAPNPTPATGASTRVTQCDLSMLVIGCHLTAHQQNGKKRNEDVLRILESLAVGKKGKYRKHYKKALRRDTHPSNPADHRVGPAKGTVAGQSTVFKTRRNASQEFDICLFGGDLNYRIEGTKGGVEKFIANRELRSVLTLNDQLTKERKHGFVLSDMQEGPLLFRPTYKYLIGRSSTTRDVYNCKPRIPAYTDRVLYRTREHLPGRLLLYTDVPEVITSDHRPVVAMLEVPTEAQPEPTESSTQSAITPGCFCYRHKVAPS